MAQGLFRFTDWFIPASLRQQEQTLERARLFVISHFCGVPLGLIVLFSLRQIDPEGGLRLWVIFGGIVGFFAYPGMLRLTGCFDLLSFASMEQFALVVLYGAFEYGGVASPFLPWLIAVPVLLLYHLGERPLYRVLVFLALAAHLGVFYAIYIARAGFPVHVLPQHLAGADLLSLFCAAVFVATTSLYHSSIIRTQRAELEREVSVRRLTEIKLREAKDEAERANRAKSEFLAKMSHELRTPLNAIIGFSHVIGSEMLGPVGLARYAEYGSDIERSGQHLLQIISEILDLARIETGKFVLREGEFDLVQLVRDAIELMRPLADARGVSVRFTSAPRPFRLYADALRMKQVLLNLLSNAAKFTGSGGLIEVGLDHERGGGVRLRVSDTGVGIPVNDIDRVLRPFEQVGNVMLNNGSGTGLGLPLTRELVLLHGGTLTLSSEVGRGTSVTVTLPEARLGEPRSGGASEPACA